MVPDRDALPQNNTDVAARGERDLRSSTPCPRPTSTTRRTYCSSARRTSRSRPARRWTSRPLHPEPRSLDLAGAKFFAITGHTHHLGQNVTVATAASPRTAARASVYAPARSWSEAGGPPCTRPEFTMPPGCRPASTSSARTTTYDDADGAGFGGVEPPPADRASPGRTTHLKGAHVCAHATYMGLGLDLCPGGLDLASSISRAFVTASPVSAPANGRAATSVQGITELLPS